LLNIENKLQATMIAGDKGLSKKKENRIAGDKQLWL
jgi:hypothetical protein